MMKTICISFLAMMFSLGVMPCAQGKTMGWNRSVALAYPETAQKSEYPGYRILKDLGWVYLLKEPYPPLWHLEEMLKKGELEQFYMCTYGLFRIYCQINISELQGRQCRELYRLCGLVAAAPFYQVDFSGERPWRYGKRTADLSMKQAADSCLSRIVSRESAARMQVDQKDLGKFSALYGAIILRGAREERAATTDDKLEKLRKEGEKNREKVWQEGREFFWDNQLFVAQDRNASMNRSIKTWLEKELIRILVGYFPGRTAEARQYIRMAGYQDSEINGLVNRTLGKSKKTEFLYRGNMNKR